MYLRLLTIFILFFFLSPTVGSNPGGVGINSIVSEDQVKKRELRLQKNRYEVYFY